MQTTRVARMLMTLAVAAPLTVGAASGDKPAFKQADANGDGKVSVSEATKAGVPKQEAKNEDIDGNGKLTEADWKFVDMNTAQQQGGSGSS